ncbi:MAG: Na/Pi cotransporter family protein [Candidatus Ranarchaeia archaeon]
MIYVNLVGGLALFMYGVTMLRESLGKISGNKITRILEKTTDNPLKGMATGTAATLMTQSSSITVLTLIGFVNAGIMTFRQSVNVMLGSEIGTTVTAQIVAFEIGLAFWPLIAIGFILKMLSKREDIQLIGNVIFSLGLIFLAMDFMKQGSRPLGESQFFIDLINEFGVNPLVGIAIGTAIAGITQSSSATTSLVIALGSSHVIGLDAAISMVLGANIGTCFLELAAGIGATTPAKRTALAQAIINVVGVLIFLPFLGPFSQLVALTSTSLPRQIANAHTVFNVIVSFIFVPLVGLLVRFCEKVIPDKEGEVIGGYFIDDNMLRFPQLALKEAENEVITISEKTLKMISLGKVALIQGDLDSAGLVLKLEPEVDQMCRNTEEFIDKIHEEQLNEHDKLWRIKLLAIITDVERVGDLANNIGEFAIITKKKEINFSSEANKELARIFDLVIETYSSAIEAFKNKNKDIARKAVDLEDKIDVLEKELKNNHINRLNAGICSARADTIFVETLRNLERMGDHADNIAYDVITSY